MVSGTARIGDLTWSDLDGDGIQDLSEPGYEGVTVRLRTCTGELLATTVSNADGAYSFEYLPPGNYQLVFAPPAGKALSPSEQGPSRSIDSNPDPVTGLSRCLPMSDGQVRPGIDAGISCWAIGFWLMTDLNSAKKSVATSNSPASNMLRTR